MAGMRERAARALSYTSLAQHPNPGPQRDAMAREALDAVLAVVAEVDGIAEVLWRHVFIDRPLYDVFWLPTCTCGWVASTNLAFDRRRHVAESVAAYILDRTGLPAEGGSER